MPDNPSPNASRRDALLRLALAARDSGYHFVTPTPATHARVNARAANRWAGDLRGVLGWSRPFRAGALAPGMLGLMQQAGMLQPWEDGWRSLLRLSSLDGQLLWHSAYPTDAPDAVFFGPDSYRFAGAIQAHMQARREPLRRAFDIGCGAGPGALTIAKAHPQAQVWAGDINPAALELAAVNADLAQAANILPVASNLLSGAEGSFDLIVANPPYLNDPKKRAYRHGGGPFGQQLALAMLKDALGRLAPGGSLLIYTGTAIVDGSDPFLEHARRLLQGRPGLDWRYRELDPDVFGEELDTPAYAEVERLAAVALEAWLARP